MPDNDGNIAIIGAGIAGLALALQLHRHGIGSVVYEAASELRELGVGLTLLPHAMRELAALGLAGDVARAGVANRTSAFFNRFGQHIYAEPRGLHAGYPYPEISLHRGRLHAILVAAVRERLGPEAIRLGHRLVELAQSDQGVTLRFKDQSAEPIVAVVLGCDGVRSSVRDIFYPGERTAFAGINTWRGVARCQPILDGRTYLRIGSIRTGKIVIYPIADDADESGSQLVNWVAELKQDATLPNEWNAPGRQADVLPTFDTFRFDWLDVGALIRQSKTILAYPMVDKDPINRWTFGNVTLVGDAAHPMYPRGSNGSAQALIDARVLANRIARTGPKSAALIEYEEERRPATTAVVLSNRSSPPDIINTRVEELVGDRPYAALDTFISQEELRALSNAYKSVAGFALDELNRVEIAK